MIDPAAPLITVVGMVLAYLAGRRNRRPKAPKPAQAICPCGHAIGYHEDHTGACNKKVIRTLNLTDKLIQCDCRRYAGPELISTAALQEIVLRDSTADDAPYVPGSQPGRLGR